MGTRMAGHALRQSSRIRRHIPFALYTAASAALMAWTIYAMVRISE